MSEISDRARHVIADTVCRDVAAVTDSTLFEDDLGMDSLDILEVLMAIEDEFPIEISEDACRSVVTVGDAIAIVERLVSEARPTTITTRQKMHKIESIIQERGATAQQAHTTAEIMIEAAKERANVRPITPLLAVDCVILDGDDRVLLIERRNFPHGWALPGGFVDVGETVEAAMAREVLEETGLSLRDVRPFGVYSEPDRDPRGHTVSVVFIARAVGTAKAADDAKAITWATSYDARDVLQLAFDHRQIVRDAFDKIFSGHIMI